MVRQHDMTKPDVLSQLKRMKKPAQTEENEKDHEEDRKRNGLSVRVRRNSRGNLVAELRMGRKKLKTARIKMSATRKNART